MVRNLKIAAAVAAVLSTGSAFAGTTTLLTGTQAQSPSVALYIAGSSAAKNAILAVLEGPTLCNSSYSVFSSTGDTNFFAVSCQPAASTGLSGANGTNIYTVWYRTEGGSVTGALPLVAGNTVGASLSQLVLTSATSGPTIGYNVAVNATATINGVDDSFPNTSKQPVQLGITDVEPAAMVKANYPSAYKASVYGSASAAQLAQLSKKAIFDQVFGIFVNTTETGFSSAQQAGNGKAAGTASGLALSTQAIANILTATDSDWSTVTDVNGNAVTSQSAPITLLNREAGSGSRTATDIFFTGDSCLKSTTLTNIQDPNGPPTGTDYFSTTDLLNAANTTPGAIAYATIDQAGASFPNLTLVALNGIQPSTLAAASGEYPEWFEAFAVTGAATPTSGDAGLLVTKIVTALQNINSTLTSGQADLLGNPNVDSAYPPAIPITGNTGLSPSSGPKAIYTNPFTRGGVSCATPQNSI